MFQLRDRRVGPARERFQMSAGKRRCSNARRSAARAIWISSPISRSSTCSARKLKIYICIAYYSLWLGQTAHFLRETRAFIECILWSERALWWFLHSLKRVLHITARGDAATERDVCVILDSSELNVICAAFQSAFPLIVLMNHVWFCAYLSLSLSWVNSSAQNVSFQSTQLDVHWISNFTLSEIEFG